MALLNLHLKVWRQTGNQPGHFQDIEAPEIPDHASFLEMMDIVNERLIRAGQDPVAFDHDCREGICGMCSMTINGMAHGPERGTTTCQLHMRKFRTGDTIWVEPFRARAFPVVKDLMVDRSAFDRIMKAGGYVSVRTGSAPEANEIPIGKDVADAAMDAAACIGCGACVASCKCDALRFGEGGTVEYAATRACGEGSADFGDGAADGCRGIWQLHEPV
jgi:succinate dehydrogenase / fumarate reductase iron-sulfur subunit